MSTYPTQRHRRLRINEQVRRLVRENRLSPDQLILPIFLKEGISDKQAISSMPGQYQHSLASAQKFIHESKSLGIYSFILFAIPKNKDDIGTENLNPKGFIAKCLQEIKSAHPDIVLISDMCFCEYTSHGHCGIVQTKGDIVHPKGYVLNDPTIDNLKIASVVHAEAGADIIAPSGMMDGMVEAIRSGLDEEELFNTIIMSYAAKYASGFYGPFREAAEGSPTFGDRRQYQMDPSNQREALKEVEQDILEGTDMIIVKPALAYLDIIQLIRQNFQVPIAAYNVSGEYSMLHAASQNNWLDLRTTAIESLMAIHRAGASMIITYFAQDFAKWMQDS